MSSQQSHPKDTRGSQENEQVQQPDPSSIIETSDKQGPVNPPKKTGIAEEQQDTHSSSGGRIRQLVSRFFPALVLLLLAILIFLFTLPFALRGQTFLPPLSLAVLLIAIVVVQGVLLYYAGSKGTYRTLYVIIGYTLFLVVGVFVVFGFGASLLMLIILFIIGFFVARRSIHTVPVGSIDIVLMSGKYVRTLQPGRHLLMPGEKISDRLNTKKIPWISPLLRAKIARDKNGRDYDVQLVATIWYQLDSEDAHVADLHGMNWETSVQEKFVSVLKNVFREVTPDDVKSWQQGAQDGDTRPERPKLFPDVKSWQQGAQGLSAVAPNTAGFTTGRTLEHITTSIAALVQQEVDDWGVRVRTVDIQGLKLIPNLAPRPNPTRPLAGAQPGSLTEEYPPVRYPNNLFPDETIGAQPTEAYPPMPELPLKLAPQYSMQPPPPVPIDEGERVVTRQEEALTIRFAIAKLNDYLLWFLSVLELTLLIEFFLTLIVSNPNNLFSGFMNVLTFIPLYPFNGIVPSTKVGINGLVIEWSTLIAMVVYFLAFYELRHFLYILISSPEEPVEDFDLKPPKATRERDFASKFAITQVRSFYQNTRRQFKPWLFFSVIAIILGTLCIASIYIIPYLGKFFPISENTTTIITIIIAAGSLYIIALLSFLQNREAYKQVDSYYTDKLVEAEKISQLTTLASRTPVSEAQEHINEKIISQILLPSGMVLDTPEKTVQGRGVPNLLRLDYYAAGDRARAANMRVVVSGEDSSYPNIESGLIVSQEPIPGTLIQFDPYNPGEWPVIRVKLSSRP